MGYSQFLPQQGRIDIYFGRDWSGVSLMWVGSGKKVSPGWISCSISEEYTQSYWLIAPEANISKMRFLNSRRGVKTGVIYRMISSLRNLYRVKVRRYRSIGFNATLGRARRGDWRIYAINPHKSVTLQGSSSRRKCSATRAVGAVALEY